MENLKEFAANAASPLFQGISSKHVSEFFDEVWEGLSAKVFRTHYASEAVENKLKKASVKPEDTEYKKKYVATTANLEAAKVCNHRRSIPKTWKSSLEKKKTRLKTLRVRARETQDKLKQKIVERKERYTERVGKQQEKLNELKKKLQYYQLQLKDKKKQSKRRSRSLKKRIKLQRGRLSRQRQRIRKLKTNHREKMRKLRGRLRNRKDRDRTAINKLKLEIRAKKETRNFNPKTSLKSYIDPRIYYEWGRQVDYDWKKYYPKSLQRKFNWVENRKPLVNKLQD